MTFEQIQSYDEIFFMLLESPEEWMDSYDDLLNIAGWSQQKYEQTLIDHVDGNW